MTLKGIVIAPDHTSQGKAPSYNQQYLRSCLLYWDMIDCPLYARSDINPFSNSSDNDLLTKEGVLRRTKGYFFTKEKDNIVFTYYIDYPKEFWLLAQIYAYEKNNNDFESWAIGQHGRTLQIDSSISRFMFVGTEGISKQNHSNVNGIHFDNRYSNVIMYDKEEKYFFGNLEEKNKTIEILLDQALPVLSDDVPVQTILEFKRKRFDELLHFRYAMEGLYLQISKSDFMMEEINHARNTIDLSLRDLKKVMDEGKLQSNLSTLIGNVSINAVALGAIEGWRIFEPYGLGKLGAFLGGTVGTVIPNLKISVLRSIFQPKEIPQQYKDYAYLYYVKRDLSE